MTKNHITAEITGRKGDMQINPDGTKTMETGGKKMIYQWKKRTIMLLSGCLLARAWAALIATSLLPF
jgi:hypothetical protein